MSIPTISDVAGLTADPETKHGIGQENKSVTNLRLAFNDSKYVNGKWENTKTFYVDGAGWDHVAEQAAELRQGDQVYVEGRLETQTWQDKDTGANRSKPYLNIRKIRKLEKRQQQNNNASAGQGGFGGQPQQSQQQGQSDPWGQQQAAPPDWGQSQNSGWGTQAPPY